MDPALITADEKHRAKTGSLRSPDFRRTVRLVWRHRRFIAVGLLASVVYGFLHSASIGFVLPVLKVILAQEGLHGWVYRTVAEDRLGVTFDTFGESTPGVDSPDDHLAFLRIKHRSPLADLSVQAGDRVVAIDGQPVGAVKALEVISQAGQQIELTLRPQELEADQEGATPRTVTVTLPAPSWEKSLLRSAAGLVPPVTQRSDRVAVLVYVLCAMVVVVVLSNVARFIAQYYTALGVLRGVMDLRRMLYSKVLRLPMDFFSQNVSDIVSRFVQDAQEIQRGLMALFGKLLREPVKAIFLLLFALYLDARMTITMLLIAPAAVVIFWQVGRKIRKANKRLLRTYGLMIGALGTTLDAIGVVKAYNAEHLERRNLWRIDRRMFRHQLKIVKLEAFLNPMLEVLGVLAVAAVAAWLGAQVIDQQIRIEEFATLVAVLGTLADPLRKMADVYPRVMRSAAGAQRIFSVLDAPAEVELLEGATTLPPLADRIEFQNVTFTYPNAPEPALRDVCATVRKGETLAIVGPNGSGKTTLARMLLRFHDPQAGCVLFDGQDIRDATLRSLRKQISLVSQDPVVFAVTVAENIAYGERNVAPERIEQAASRAYADEFIRQKADGYDELLGEHGSTLSGGQRQRLCIARAVLRNAPILIFDEATSQVDAESEHKIQQSVAELAKGRTTFIIAHRLSTIRFASRILVMDRGRVLDTGTHDELLERCPLYSALCQTQLAQ